MTHLGDREQWSQDQCHLIFYLSIRKSFKCFNNQNLIVVHISCYDSLTLILNSTIEIMEKISLTNLVHYLQDKKQYIGTSIYLKQVRLFNPAVYGICNMALETVLLKNKSDYMGKLLALRFFKELFVTGNITLIDGLNEKIEDHIVEVAQYNKNSPVNRGKNYFIQHMQIPKTQDVQKIGVSYVMMASEIIMVGAKWYPQDEYGEKTRLFEYYSELKAVGVPFGKEGSYNFFKKEEEEKFRTGYQKWLKWHVQQVKEEEIEQTTKNIAESKGCETDEVRQQEVSNKQKPIMVDKKIQTVQKPKQKLADQLVQKQAVNAVEILEPKQQQIKDLAQENKPIVSSILLNNIAESKKQSEQKGLLLTQLAKKEQMLIQLQKDKRELIAKYEVQIDQLQKYKNRKDRIMESQRQRYASLLEKQKQLDENEKSLNETIKKIKEAGYQKDKEVSRLRALLEQSQKSRLQERGKEKEQNYQIKVSPPVVNDVLKEKNEMLQAALDNVEKHFKIKEISWQDELTRVREELSDAKLQIKNLTGKNQLLSLEVTSKQAQLEKYRNQKNIHEELVQKIVRDDSLLIEEEPRMEFTTKLLNSHLGTSLEGQIKSQIDQVKEVRRHKLRKTQSQHQLQGSKRMYQTFNSKGFGANPDITSKMAHTASNFSCKPSGINSYVTYFPYLDNYFSPLPRECSHFKQICLSSSANQQTFFQNQILKITITKKRSFDCVLAVLNKTKIDFRINIVSEHNGFMIRENKKGILRALQWTQFEVVSQKVDLNLRYPVVRVQLECQRQNIYTSCIVPLPLTLLEFCAVENAKENRWISDANALKYSSDQIEMSENFQDLNNNFGNCEPLIEENNGKIIRFPLEMKGLADSQLLVEVSRLKNKGNVSVLFRGGSTNSSSLAKVVMQTLLFLLQK